VEADAATDGWYALLTTLPAQIDAAQVLIRYKVKKWWNAAIRRSQARWPSRRCSSRPTGASRP
jgi:hypothetical protein